MQLPASLPSSLLENLRRRPGGAVVIAATAVIALVVAGSKSSNGWPLALAWGASLLVVAAVAAFYARAVLVRVLGERELEAERLADEMQRFRAIVESAGESILVVGSKGDVRSCNPSSETIFGIPVDEIVGGRVSRLVPGLDAPAFRRLARRCEIGARVEVKGRRANGELFPVRLSASRTNIAGEDLMTLLLSDVTEEKSLAAQLSEAQKLESIGRIAAGIAHEINTPTQFVTDNVRFLEQSTEDLLPLLRAVATLVEADESSESGDAEPSPLSHVADVTKAYHDADVEFLLEELPRATEQSLEGLGNIAAIVAAMKDFSHPGQEKKVLIDVNHAVESAVTVSRNEWKQFASLELELDPLLPPVECLAAEVNQVLLNLLVNAGHAIEDRGRDQLGVIRVETRATADAVEIAISDDGCGMTEETRVRIFEPFFTTKGVGRGTGQGLALAHSVIVDRHGGAIRVESEPDVGTTFILSLPAGVAASAERAAA